MLKVLQTEPYGVQAYCPRPYHSMYVLANGSATFCCFQGAHVGNVLQTPIMTIWKNEVAKQMRASCESDEMHPFCSSRGTCPLIGRELKKSHVHFNPQGPISLEFPLPSTHCNIGGNNPSDEKPACIMCPRNYAVWRNNGVFEMDQTEALIEACRPVMPHLKQISIMGVAEPFWKGRAFDVLDGLGFPQYKQNITFFCFHNGTCMPPATAQRLWDYADHTDLRWSVDAATRETYKSIRRIEGFRSVKRNMDYYNKFRDKTKHKSIICNNINTLNVKELPLMVEYAKEVGADCLNITPTIAWLGEIRKIMVNRDNLTMFNDYLAQAKEKARELGVMFTQFQKFEEVI